MLLYIVRNGQFLTIDATERAEKASTLKGPFECRRNENGTHEIIGNDGFPAVWVIGDHNAKVVTKLMNLADERGVLERIKPQPPKQEPERVETDGFVIVT